MIYSLTNEASPTSYMAFCQFLVTTRGAKGKHDDGQSKHEKKMMANFDG